MSFFPKANFRKQAIAIACSLALAPTFTFADTEVGDVANYRIEGNNDDSMPFDGVTPVVEGVVITSNGDSSGLDTSGAYSYIKVLAGDGSAGGATDNGTIDIVSNQVNITATSNGYQDGHVNISGSQIDLIGPVVTSGNVTIGGNLDMTSGSISNVTSIAMGGALTGATTINASGQITSGSLSTGAITATGVNAGSGTIQTTGTVSAGTVSATTGNITTLNSTTVSNSGNVGTATLSTSGLATLNSASVTNGLTVGGATTLNNTLAVNSGGGSTELTVGTGTVDIVGGTNISGATNINTSGTANTAIGNSTGTVGVTGSSTSLTGSTSTMTLNSSGVTVGVATNESMNFSVNGSTIVTIDGTGMTVTGNTTVYGKTTIIDTTATVNSLAVQSAVGTDVFHVDASTGAMTSTGNATIATDVNTTNTFGSGSGSTNTIGNAGTSANTVTGATNALTASTSNIITGPSNVIQSATSGSNNRSVITADGTQASVQFVDASGDSHGLTVNNTSTTLSGGTRSSVLTLADGSTTLTVAGATSGNAVQLISATTNATTTTSALTLGTLATFDSAGSVNTLQGSTNTITAETGSNAISGYVNNNVTAVTGSNTISANAANQSNTLSATGTNGVNNITANASTGTNNIEAKTNSIGVATSASINTIGNATTSANTMQGATNVITGTTSINASVNYATNINTGTNTQAVAIGNTGLSTTNTVNAYSGNTTMSLANNTASLTAGSTLATNGITGVTSGAGSGGLTVYNSAQTIAANESIPTTLSPTGILAGKTYQNKVNGNLLVDGNVYINGTLDYVSSNTANTTVIGSTTGVGASILTDATEATNGGTAIVLKGATGTQTVVDANGKLTNVVGTATQSTAALTLTNGIGNTHGLVITETQATLSGGTRSSSLTMADNGGTFSDSATGAPVQVHGVNDGTSDFDAVNVRQFSSAIASVTAMANIPQVDQDKKVAVGVALGSFMGKTALAAGVTYRFTKNGVFKGSISSAMNSSQTTAVGLGAAWSY